jgi:hypothetical protein
MSEPNPTPRRKGIIEYIEKVPDPAEDARFLEQIRQFRKTALSKIGPSVAEAPPELLAQYVAEEMEADERQTFLAELVRCLPEDVLRGLGEALQARLGRGAT